MPTQTNMTMTTPPPGVARRRAGLTLVELMVAMSIMVILTLAVSQIIAQAQRVVSVGHTSMRANGKIGALKNIVRDDLRRITPAGFLYISSPASDQGFLAFTTAGPADSMTNSGNASGTIATYGLRHYEGAATVSGKTEPEQALLRVNVMMNLAGGTGETSDTSSYDLSHFQSNSSNAATAAEGLHSRFKYNSPDKMRLRQQDLELTDIDDHLWKVMTPQVTDLKFFWTDGTLDGNNELKWYGADKPKRGESGADPIYAAKIEPAGSPYKAIWTNEIDSKYWPKAIRIVVTIHDDTAKNLPGKQYEIICPVGP